MAVTELDKALARYEELFEKKAEPRERIETGPYFAGLALLTVLQFVHSIFIAFTIAWIIYYAWNNGLILLKEDKNVDYSTFLKKKLNSTQPILLHPQAKTKVQQINLLTQEIKTEDPLLADAKKRLTKKHYPEFIKIYEPMQGNAKADQLFMQGLDEIEDALEILRDKSKAPDFAKLEAHRNFLGSWRENNS